MLLIGDACSDKILRHVVVASNLVDWFASVVQLPEPFGCHALNGRAAKPNKGVDYHR